MRRLYLGGNNYVIRRLMQANDAAATGLTLTGFFSETKTGATIHADISVSLAEGDTAGDYRSYEAAISAANLTARLAEYAGQVIYERCEGTNYDDHDPVLVVAARPVGAE